MRCSGALAHLGAVAMLTFGIVAAQAHEFPTPAVVARFTSQRVDADGVVMRPTTWCVWREAQRVATGSPSAGVREIWSRDPASGDVSLARVFDGASKVVEYTAGELAARGVDVERASIGTVVDPRSLSMFERAGDRVALGYTANLLRQRRGRDVVELEWIPDLALPARIERSFADGTRSTFTLEAIGDAARQDCAPVVAAVPAEHETLDAADFGDMEGDPFVQQVEAYDERTGRWRVGGAHPH